MRPRRIEDLSRHLFIDIETVPAVGDYGALPPGMQHHWERKSLQLKVPDGMQARPDALFGERAGLYSEFNKVVAIGLGCFVQRDGVWKIVTRCLASHDEKTLLNEFCSAIGRFTNQQFNNFFVGHNIREFDLPCLCRRFLVNGLSLPSCLDIAGQPSWKIIHVVDTMDLWKFGDYKHFTSLDLLAEIFDVPSSKSDIDGSDVARVYWQEEAGLQRIAEYCMRDVFTTARVYLKLSGIFDLEPGPEYHPVPLLEPAA